MKSCIEWRKGFKHLPQIDEFNIDYRNKEVKLINFLDLYAKTQRVNIRLPEDYTQNDIELLEAAFDRGYKIALILPDRYYANRLKEKGIPFYFSTPVITWDDFTDFVHTGVSDIFISGGLGFELNMIGAIARMYDVQIRCYANICQPRAYDEDGGLKSFYIRPEDVDFYSNYVDVIEFYDSVEQQNTLYEIYFKDREWNGKLREIIKGMTAEVNNYYILGGEFARRRSQCGKRCLKGERCELCDRLIDLANSLENSPNYQVFKRR